MGWSFGWSSRAQMISEVEAGYMRSGYAVLDRASVLGAHFMAVEKGGISFVITMLTQKNGGDWGCKEMSEDMGPTEARCPVRLLEVTSGLEGQGSADWRERVRDHNRAKAREFKPGDLVLIYGKPYTVLGKVKRSYEVRRMDTSKVYKASPTKMVPA